MQDTYTSSNHRDFNARYSHTYGWLVKNNTKLLVYLLEGDNDYLSFRTDTTHVYRANINAGTIFEFIPIKQGWFNSSDNQVVFLQRIPARQWKRGICSENTRASILASYPHSTDLDYKLLYSLLVNPINITKDFIVNNVNNGLPVALSNYFAISNKQEVYFYHQNIGVFSKNTIVLNDNLVLQELSDCVNRLNLNWTIKYE